MAISTPFRLIKAGSSGWMSEVTSKGFKGYAALTVSLSNLDSVKHYVDPKG